MGQVCLYLRMIVLCTMYSHKNREAFQLKVVTVVKRGGFTVGPTGLLCAC